MSKILAMAIALPNRRYNELYSSAVASGIESRADSLITNALRQGVTTTSNRSWTTLVWERLGRDETDTALRFVFRFLESVPAEERQHILVKETIDGLAVLEEVSQSVVEPLIDVRFGFITAADVLRRRQ